MHTITRGKTRIHFNSDLSGDALITDPETGEEMEVPAIDLVEIVLEVVQRQMTSVRAGLE